MLYAYTFLTFFLIDGNPFMASASTLGHIAFWDLEKCQLGTVLHDAHEGTVSGMKFLPSEPLLVTNGPDNSLKVTILLQQDFLYSGPLVGSFSVYFLFYFVNGNSL